MRALIVALAIAGVAGVANAVIEVPVAGPIPIAPSGARQQAENAIRDDLGDPDRVTFRIVRVMEAASVRRSAFADPIDGPIAVVCGQYSSPGRAGGYSWFFVAIKQGHVLWTSRGPGEAYYSCEGAGLTPARTHGRAHDEGSVSLP